MLTSQLTTGTLVGQVVFGFLKHQKTKKQNSPQTKKQTTSLFYQEKSGL